MPSIRAEILSIGTELLLGEIVDTNAAYLARRLARLGIDLFHVSQVGDNLGRCAAAIELALSRSDLLVTTGGLGPTEDDLTREAIAQVLREEPRVDPALEADLRAWFGARGLEMPARNLKQAWLIPSATALPNPNGTAPGWWVRRGGAEIVSLPGVPREMTAMWEAEIEPHLAGRGRPLVTRTLKLLGIGESAVEEALGDLVRSAFPTVATYAKSDGVHVRIAAKAETDDEARTAVGRVEREIRGRLAPHVWGVDDDVLVQRIDAALARRGLRLAIADELSGAPVRAALSEAIGAERLVGGARGADERAVVSLAVSADAEQIVVTARHDVRVERSASRFRSPSEASRRAVLAALDALRRVLDVGAPE